MEREFIFDVKKKLYNDHPIIDKIPTVLSVIFSTYICSPKLIARLDSINGEIN